MKGSKKWYLGVMVAAAFLSFLAGIHIDSAFADEHQLNTALWVLCPAFGVVALLFLYLASKTPKV